MTNTIALVDDDRNILTSVSMALEAEDFVVKTYRDDEDALGEGVQTPREDVRAGRVRVSRIRSRAQGGTRCDGERGCVVEVSVRGWIRVRHVRV